MKRVRKAVIPVAGMGTRFLPVTKSVPKELLPIGSKPTLQFVVEEAVKSGIEEVVLVSSRDKTEIENYFRTDTAYDKKLYAAGKSHLLSELYGLLKKVKITTVFQDEPRGLGHAVLCAKDAVGKEPFVVILPDVIIESETPCCLQLIEAFDKTGVAVNAAEHVPMKEVSLYGVYDIAKSEGRYHTARGVVEKPLADEAPSDLCVVGRYLFDCDLFEILEKTEPGKNGEIQLADAMNTLARAGKMIAYEYEGRQFDTGDLLGFLKANIYYGGLHFKGVMRTFIDNLKF